MRPLSTYPLFFSFFFFFNDTATTEIYTFSLHDALPIWFAPATHSRTTRRSSSTGWPTGRTGPACRSEEHTSELQSLTKLVCRLLLEKKKNKKKSNYLIKKKKNRYKSK